MGLGKLEASGYVTAADGVRLYFEAVGNGPQKVLVPNGFYYRDDFVGLAEGRTLVFFDLRNRGRSDAVSDTSKLEKGVWNDVEDLEVVRRAVGAEKVALMGHSYVGLTVLLYAMKYPERVSRVVALSPAPAEAAKQYPAHLSAPNDGVMQQVFARLGELQKERAAFSPEEFCKRCWAVLAGIYVADAAKAQKVEGWGRCELANERNFMKYWTGAIFPSLQALRLGPEDYARATAPVLIVHGRKDRSAAYGGARDWAMSLPEARLLTLEDAAHAPWVEEPRRVLGAVETFLGGAWPAGVEKAKSGHPRTDEPTAS